MEISKELVDATKCVSCGKSRIKVALKLSDGKQVFSIRLSPKLFGKNWCDGCNQEEYYKNIENPLLT